MKYSATLFSLVLVSVFSLSSAQAACGGGGFKSSNRSKPSTEVIAQPQSHLVSYEGSSSSRQVSTSQRAESPTFSSRFDGMANDLHLTSTQWDEISDAKRNVSRRAGELQQDLDKANLKLSRCSGDCEKERRKVGEAQSRLEAFDSKAEFDRRVGVVLTAEQKRQYDGK
jgi:chromosome segregation ATPase